MYGLLAIAIAFFALFAMGIAFMLHGVQGVGYLIGYVGPVLVAFFVFSAVVGGALKLFAWMFKPEQVSQHPSVPLPDPLVHVDTARSRASRPTQMP